MHIVMGNGADFLHVPADLLVANIHHAVIDDLTSREAFFTKHYYLLSGLLGSEGARISEKLAPASGFWTHTPRTTGSATSLKTNPKFQFLGSGPGSWGLGPENRLMIR